MRCFRKKQCHRRVRQNSTGKGRALERTEVVALKQKIEEMRPE